MELRVLLIYQSTIPYTLTPNVSVYPEDEYAGIP